MTFLCSKDAKFVVTLLCLSDLRVRFFYALGVSRVTILGSYNECHFNRDFYRYC